MKPNTETDRLASLRDILKTLCDEETIRLLDSVGDCEYLRQFNATKIAVLKAIEKCANEK